MIYKCPKCRIKIEAIAPRKVKGLKCQFCKTEMEELTLDDLFEVLAKNYKEKPKKGGVHPLLIEMGYSRELEDQE